MGVLRQQENGRQSLRRRPGLLLTASRIDGVVAPRQQACHPGGLDRSIGEGSNERITVQAWRTFLTRRYLAINGDGLGRSCIRPAHGIGANRIAPVLGEGGIPE